MMKEKRKQIQAKDIPEQPIIDYLIGLNGKWATHWTGMIMPSITENAIPPNTPEKVILAKLRAMIKKGVIQGCACGCRGDFRIERES